MALPSNVGKGTVTGRFIDAFGANIAGTITFTPSPRRLLNATAAPSPVTILPKPVTVALVDGTFVQQLVATDDPDNNPQDWTYAVSFNLTDAKADSFSIEVGEGQTVDLTTVTPVATGNGTMIVRGAGVPDVEGVENGRVLILVDGEPQWGAAPGGGPGGPISPDDIAGATTVGKAVLTGDQAAARSAIGAGTSNLALGTTSSTAKAGDYQPTAEQISNATTVGRNVLKATDAAAARTAIGAGTSSVVVGTGAGDAKAGNYQPTAANISDASATGRNVLTAASQAAARTAIGAAAAADLASVSPTIDNLPAGSVIRVFYTGSAWPTRPTARGDVSVEWIDLTGSASSTTMPTGFNESVDTFWQTANV